MFELKHGDKIIFDNGRTLVWDEKDDTPYKITEDNVFLIYAPTSMYSWGYISIGKIKDIVKGVK